MLGIERTTTSTPGWFKMQVPAIKEVFKGLSTAEQAGLDAEQEKMERQGYQEQTKQR
jgi:hypothetical protein